MSEQPGYLQPVHVELDRLRQENLALTAEAIRLQTWSSCIRAATHQPEQQRPPITRAEAAEAELALVRDTLTARTPALDRVTTNALDGLIANGTLKAARWSPSSTFAASTRCARSDAATSANGWTTSEPLLPG